MTIAIVELADELGTYRASIHKIAKRLGIETTMRRDPARGNQMVAFVSDEGADAIRKEYAQNSLTTDGVGSGSAEFAPNEGVFYLLQLEPDHDPGRFKVGFTTDLDGRLRHLRCSAPFAEYLRTWNCRRTWERAAIDCITEGLEQLHTEVFRAPSLEEVAERGDRFFSVMPSVGGIPEYDDEETHQAQGSG